MTYETIAQEDEKYSKYLKATHGKFCEGALTFTEQEPYMADLVAEEDTDFILHVNGDSVFTDSFDVDMLMEEGKIVMPYTSYETIITDPSIPEGMMPIILNSQESVRKALGESQEYEYARRLPIMYPKSLYAEFRDFIEVEHSLHVKNFFDVEDVPSYFNLMGAYCYKYRHDEFLWVNTETSVLKDIPFIQSVAGKDFVIIL